MQWMHMCIGWVYRCMDRWIGGQMNEWMDGQMDNTQFPVRTFSLPMREQLSSASGKIEEPYPPFLQSSLPACTHLYHY